MRKIIGFAIAGALGSGALASACGGSAEYVVRGTEKSVGVDGMISIAPQQEDVNLITVDLVNLPPPERHDKDKKFFVVWMTPFDGQVIKAGRLAYDADARRGVLTATIPNDEVFVQVTAEAVPDATKPSDFVVISKHVTLKRAGAGESGAGL